MLVIQSSILLNSNKSKSNESWNLNPGFSGSGLTTLLKTSHSLGCLKIFGDCDGNSNRSDVCIDGFDDGKNDSLLLGAAISTENGCVLGNSEGTTVCSWDGWEIVKVLDITDRIILGTGDGTKEGFSDSLQQGFPG